MSRYITALIERDVVTEKRKLSTVIISALPQQDADVYIAVTGTERLDKLALLFYQDSSLWWIIAAANGLGKGTLMVPGGINLRIPSITNIQSYINEINLSR
jgi:hypothetical protein